MDGKLTREQVIEALTAMLTPIRIYDVNIDQYRPITQADVDQMQTICQQFGKIIMQVEASRAVVRGEAK